MHALRPYQEEALEELTRTFRAGAKARKHYDRLLAQRERQAKAKRGGRPAIPERDGYTGAGL